MRRSDRALSEQETLDLLRRAEYGVLSTVGPSGQAYGQPLNFCLLDGSIYFHSAPEGQKLDNIRANARVSFCVVGHAEVLSHQFAMRYASAIVFGTAEEVFNGEKHRALEALVAKYSPGHIESGRRYIEQHQADVRVFRIRIERVTGKARR